MPSKLAWVEVSEVPKWKGELSFKTGPPRQAYSHSASVVKRNITPLLESRLFNRSQNSFAYVGNAPAGSATGDLVRYGGLTDGTPQWVNGLRYMVSYSMTGNLHGINRATTPQVVANGFDLGGNPITRSAVMLLKLQRNARIKKDAMKGTFWYTHETQVNSFKEIGYDMEYIPLQGGKADGFDPFFRGAVTFEGEMIVEGQHADQQAWYMLVPDAFGRVKFSDPYWAMAFGQRVYNTYNAGGTPNLQMASTFLNPLQFFLDNAAAQGVLVIGGVLVLVAGQGVGARLVVAACQQVAASLAVVS